MSVRRTRMDIVYDMLRAIQNKGGKIKPTHLMYKANLSHSLMNSYLEELSSKGFVSELSDNGNKMLALTDKGFEFINQFKKMKEFEKAFGL